MNTTTENTQGTESAPNYYYNYGYGLFVGVKDFNGNYQTLSDNLTGLWGTLPKTETSLKYIANMLYEVKSGIVYRDYQDAIKLFNGQATLIHTIQSILYFAKNLKKGETLVITFATHGIMLKRTYGSGRINTMMLSDSFITEDELYYLLKFFKEDTRIFIIFDCCHSGSFLNWQPKDEWEEAACISAFCERIATFDQSLSDALSARSWELIGSDLNATVYIYGVTSDFNEVNDFFNGSFFMYQAAKTWNGYEQIIDNFVLRNQAKVKSFIRGYIDDIEDINPGIDNHTLVTAGKAYWRNMFSIVNRHLFKTNIDPDTVPEYDPNNSNHKYVMSKILPSLNKIGKNHDKYADYKLFRVDK